MVRMRLPHSINVRIRLNVFLGRLTLPHPSHQETSFQKDHARLQDSVSSHPLMQCGWLSRRHVGPLCFHPGGGQNSAAAAALASAVVACLCCSCNVAHARHLFPCPMPLTSKCCVHRSVQHRLIVVRPTAPWPTQATHQEYKSANVVWGGCVSTVHT